MNELINLKIGCKGTTFYFNSQTFGRFIFLKTVLQAIFYALTPAYLQSFGA